MSGIPEDRRGALAPFREELEKIRARQTARFLGYLEEHGHAPSPWERQAVLRSHEFLWRDVDQAIKEHLEGEQ